MNGTLSNLKTSKAYESAARFFLGSARVPRAVVGVSPTTSGQSGLKRSIFFLRSKADRRDAGRNTRDACAPQINCASSAFTLIEVLISIAVFAIIMVAISNVFFGALNLRRKTVESIDAAIPAEQALSIIRNDLMNIVPPPTNGGVFFATLDTTAANTNTSGDSMPSQTQQGMNSPVFTTSNGHVDDSTYWGDVQKISYYLANSTNGGVGRDLIRNVTRNLLPVMQADNDPQPILNGVQSIFFYYHDGSQWKEIWTTNETLRLPRAIKVQILMASAERGVAPPPPLEVIASLVDAGTNTTATATQ